MADSARKTPVSKTQSAPKAVSKKSAGKQPAPAKIHRIAPQGKAQIEHRETLRAGIKSLNRRILAQLILTSITLVAIVYFGLLKDRYIYFAATEDWRLRELRPLNVPMLSRPAVIKYAIEGAVAANSFRFNTIPTDMERAGQYFTVEGWRSFEAAMRASGNLDKPRAG